MPSLSTSLCMLSGPGALPRLRNLTILMRVSESMAQITPITYSAGDRNWRICLDKIVIRSSGIS